MNKNDKIGLTIPQKKKKKNEDCRVNNIPISYSSSLYSSEQLSDYSSSNDETEGVVNPSTNPVAPNDNGITDPIPSRPARGNYAPEKSPPLLGQDK